VRGDNASVSDHRDNLFSNFLIMTKSATISVKDGEQRITILVSNGDPERVLSTIENAM
jgi:hypothetical protein